MVGCTEVILLFSVQTAQMLMNARVFVVTMACALIPLGALIVPAMMASS